MHTLMTHSLTPPLTRFLSPPPTPPPPHSLRPSGVDHVGDLRERDAADDVDHGDPPQSTAHTFTP